MYAVCTRGPLQPRAVSYTTFKNAPHKKKKKRKKNTTVMDYSPLPLFARLGSQGAWFLFWNVVLQVGGETCFSLGTHFFSSSFELVHCFSEHRFWRVDLSSRRSTRCVRKSQSGSVHWANLIPYNNSVPSRQSSELFFSRVEDSLRELMMCSKKGERKVAAAAARLTLQTARLAHSIVMTESSLRLTLTGSHYVALPLLVSKWNREGKQGKNCLLA